MCKVVTDGNMAELRKLLLDCDVNAASEPDSKYSGKSPLHIVCESGRLNVAQLLLAQPTVDVNVRTPYDETPLLFACQARHVDIVRLLLARPETNVNCSNGNQWTPLHSACENGFADIVQLLMSRPELDVTGISWRRTPLHLACQQGHVDVVRLLLSHPLVSYHVESAKVANATPVHLAVKRQHTVVVQALVLHALAALISDSVAVAASATQFLAAFLAPEFPLDITARADVIQAVWAAHEDAAERRTMRNRLLEQSPAQPHDVLSRVVW
ncbi:hypothetical protein, variant [Aphanomyces astaci]|nr:hypothetical protein, variant [Aphanomyces astaci]ETV70635.1 hypothetical protein, variant [Aphanomyces astaci]|eukprot:XP_009840018.1 hypothetical protein, variant [Aphanomyces astaci]